MEQQATRAAATVMTGGAPQAAVHLMTPIAPTNVFANTPRVSSVVDPVLRSRGQLLESGARGFMEARFGHDFGRVRVHTDAAADRSARSMGALAYAVGTHLVFAAGQYRPQTSEGRRLLAHELAHTLQPGTASGELRRQPAPEAKKVKEPAEYGHDAVFTDIAKFKPLYVRWRTELSDAITSKCGPADPIWPDYRFVLPLAQRMVEQDGPHATAQGNNPYNVMGKGDADTPTFNRAGNKEIVEGKSVNVPADFANFKSESSSHDAYLGMLEKNWPAAFQAIRTGGSVAQFIGGLFPGAPHNFATASKEAYAKGVKLRATLVIEDLRNIYRAYLKDYQRMVESDAGASAGQAAAGSNAPHVMTDAEMHRLAVQLIETELQQLANLKARIQGDQPIRLSALQGPAGGAGANP